MLSPNSELHIENKIPWQPVYTEKDERALLLKRHFIVNRFPIEQMWIYTSGIRIPLPQQTKLNLSNCFQIPIVIAIPSFKHL